LFATCLADRFFADACADAAWVLRHFGVEVHVPARQTCCGQPAYNSGHRHEAARMARHTAEIFRAHQWVVLPSGSCAGMIRRFYPELLEEDGHTSSSGSGHAPSARDEAHTARTSSLATRTYELAEFLVHVVRVLDLDAGRPGPRIGSGLSGVRISYHHGCHALRELGIREEPVALLEACGAEILPWPGDVECCGFGGMFSTKFPEVSAGMADRKLDALDRTVDLVTSADGGCLMQLSARARRRGLPVGVPPEAGSRFVHLATLLRRGLES